MKHFNFGMALVGSFFLLACPTPQPTPQCTPQSCANGCCSSTGECVTEQTASACGLNGTSCSTCASGLCFAGICDAASLGGGDGSTGGGGGSAGGGSGGCDGVALDPVLGSLDLKAGMTVAASGNLPSGFVAVGVSGSVLYGLKTDNTIRALGQLPSLAEGPVLAQVLTPDDVAADAGVYLGGYLAVAQSRLLAGYTKAGAGFPGSVVEYNVEDAGVRYLDAPGNYSAAGFGDAFLINAVSVGAANGAGAYVLEPQHEFAFATFDSSWQASSGVVGVTTGGVVLVGYFNGQDFRNYVRAVPPGAYESVMQSQLPLSLTAGAPVLAADDMADFTTLGNDVIVVRGGYESEPPYASFTLGVERLSLAVHGSGASQHVGVGTPVRLIDAPDKCTKVFLAVGTSAGLLLGVEDANGRRLVQLAP